MPMPIDTRASAGVLIAAVVAIAAPATITAPRAIFANVFIFGLLVFLAGPLKPAAVQIDGARLNRT
jgi:hypothetical protein